MQRLIALLIVSFWLGLVWFLCSQLDIHIEDHKGIAISVSILALFWAIIAPRSVIENTLDTIEKDWGLNLREDGPEIFAAIFCFMLRLLFSVLLVGFLLLIAEQFDTDWVWLLCVATSILFFYLNVLHQELNEMKTKLDMVLTQLTEKEQKEEA